MFTYQSLVVLMDNLNYQACSCSGWPMLYYSEMVAKKSYPQQRARNFSFVIIFVAFDIPQHKFTYVIWR